MTRRVMAAHELKAGMQAVPLTRTVVDPTLGAAQSVLLTQIAFVNTDLANSCVLTISDAASLTCSLLTINPGEDGVFSWPEGKKCNGGLFWAASRAGLNAEGFGHLCG